MEFEDILQSLGELVRSELFQIQNEVDLMRFVGVQGGSIKTHILTKFRVTNSLITRLENEYESFILNFNTRLRDYQKQ
jgi:hypothetical protein